MGTLFYSGSTDPIHLDDRALAHLKVVVATKLRRHESFTLSWRHPDGQPGGRSTIWLHPSIPLRFVFDDPEPTELNRRWIEELASSASSSGGIQLTAEHVVAEPHVVQADMGHDVSLGAVHVEALDVGRLTIADSAVNPTSDEV